LNQSNLKKCKFKINTTYTNSEDIYVKRATHRNILYIYVYERGILRDNLLLALRVEVII
jgi:hypothetical protein